MLFVKTVVLPDAATGQIKENGIMKIEVLGTGCAKCKTLYENVRRAVAEGEYEAEISKVEEIQKIMAYGIMSTPALVINGQVKCSGKVVSVAEIMGML